MPRYSDYSKPAYYYRLFHEGRSASAMMEAHLFNNLTRWNEIIISGQSNMEKQPTNVFPTTDFLGSMPYVLPEPPAQSVDPLDGVW